MNYILGQILPPCPIQVYLDSRKGPPHRRSLDTRSFRHGGVHSGHRLSEALCREHNVHDLDTDPQGQIRKDSAWLHGILISLTDAASQVDFLLRSMFVPDQYLDVASQEGCFHDSILLLLCYRLDSVHVGLDDGLVGLDHGLKYDLGNYRLRCQGERSSEAQCYPRHRMERPHSS